METPNFTLTWVSQPIEECLSGAGPIEGRVAEFRIDGPERVVYELWMGHCAASNRWYGLLPDLEEMLAEEGWHFDRVDGFAINGTAVRTGVLVGARHQVVPWSTFREQSTNIPAREDTPPPSIDAVRTLEQRPTTWELAWAPVGWVRERKEESPSLIYAAVVHDASGYLRTVSLYPGTPPAAEPLAELVRRAAGTPDEPAVPLRPATLRLADADMAAALKDALAALDIALETAATPQADDALAGLVEHLSPNLPPPFLSEADEDTLRAYFTTAADFYETAPWRRFEGHKYLGVQFDDGPWHYANVMGQEEEAPGLSLFDDWLHLCRFHNNQPSGLQDLFSELMGEPLSLSPLEAAGAAEAMTLDTLPILHPADAARVQALGIEPLRDDEYPLPYRYDAEGGLVAPHFALADYHVLMRAILIALERRRATPVTSIKTMLDIDERAVTLRYPADGTERSVDGPPSVRLVIEGRDAGPDPTALPEGLNLHVDAPISATFEDVARALKDADEDFQYIGVGSGEAVLWDDRGRRKAPCPRMDDLLSCEDLWVELLFTDFSAYLHPQESAPDAIHVELVEA